MFNKQTLPTPGFESANGTEAAPYTNRKEESPGETLHPRVTLGNLRVEHYRGLANPRGKINPGWKLGLSIASLERLAWQELHCPKLEGSLRKSCLATRAPALLAKQMCLTNNRWRRACSWPLGLLVLNLHKDHVTFTLDIALIVYSHINCWNLYRTISLIKYTPIGDVPPPPSPSGHRHSVCFSVSPIFF